MRAIDAPSRESANCCGLLDVRYAPIATKFRSAAE
jgi:hypothetical protein